MQAGKRSPTTCTRTATAFCGGYVYLTFRLTIYIFFKYTRVVVPPCVDYKTTNTAVARLKKSSQSKAPKHIVISTRFVFVINAYGMPASCASRPYSVYVTCLAVMWRVTKASVATQIDIPPQVCKPCIVGEWLTCSALLLATHILPVSRPEMVE